MPYCSSERCTDEGGCLQDYTNLETSTGTKPPDANCCQWCEEEGCGGLELAVRRRELCGTILAY